ncbi:MAG TPA: DHA2 family efflux MFS transporter permease subunit [Solirubrobacteraceae bacterium]|nr:DHA2 family efflux MFS transporter permease subunit [Solirubrobacteraceae bacterium]
MLALLGVAQLMVVLDATIVNIALPSAQKALHFSNDNRQWIITAYALAFGSLLLLGGKLGDLFGRKWTFVAGLVGFSIASAIGGLSQSFGMLVAARALQGVFGALLAPSALSLLTVTFAGSPDRPKAFGIFGAIAGGGASVGLILGGVLTQALSWRWCLYVNLVIAIPTTLMALRLLVNHAHPQRPRIDVPGVVVGSLGLFALVYGFSNAETHSWTAPLTIVALAASVVLLVAFVAIERRTSDPLLPLHVVWDRARGGAYASIALAGSGVFGVFLFLTYYMQQNLGFSPLMTGVAFLPMTAMIVVTATTVQTRVLGRTGAKPLVVTGMLFGIVAMVLFTRLHPGGSYAADVLPGLILIGFGMGCIFAPAFSTATLGVPSQEAGIASAMVNTAQQVGGSVGTALLSTLFASAAASYAASHVHASASAALIHGYTTAFWWATGIFTLGLLVALVILPGSIRSPAPVGEASLATE